MRFYFLFIFFFFLFFNFFNGDQWHVLPRIRSTLKNYFSEKDSPFNIAVFRIIFFGYILVSFINKERIVWFSQLPPDLQFPPVGMGYFLSIVPVTPDLAQRITVLFLGFSFLAMIGCFTRAASFGAAICGIYVLGIPQFYGKVDHYNHLIWFMLILGVSRCSDVLSVDSVWKAFREADQGRMPKNQNSVEYALPLRFIWLLMGVIYFFPGFWKIFLSQSDWAWSDNLKYQLYARWFELGGWLPFFRLDQYPLLYKMFGFLIIVFELSFVFLILFPALRPIAAISGLLFHGMVELFLKIGFFHLQVCYVSFVNWAGFFAKIGERIFKEPLRVRYDGKSRSYRRMIAVLVKFDIFQHIVQADPQAPQRAAISSIAQTRLLRFAGIALLLINSVFGFREIMAGWPFACYPTFAGRMFAPTIKTITPYGVTENNKEEVVGLNVLKQRMKLSRLTGTIQSILAMPDEDQKRGKLKALLSVMRAEGVDLRNYSKVRFYKTTYLTQPGKASDPPVSKELLAEIGI